MNDITNINGDFIKSCNWEECKFNSDNKCQNPNLILYCTNYLSSIENLKILVDKMGYKLIKKPAREHYLPCVCGCRQREHWTTVGNNKTIETLKCKKCGIEVSGKKSDTRTLWNDMIRELKNKENNNEQ